MYNLPWPVIAGVNGLKFEHFSLVPCSSTVRREQGTCLEFCLGLLICFVKRHVLYAGLWCKCGRFMDGPIASIVTKLHLKVYPKPFFLQWSWKSQFSWRAAITGHEVKRTTSLKPPYQGLELTNSRCYLKRTGLWTSTWTIHGLIFGQR